jgi:hypothetical protein
MPDISIKQTKNPFVYAGFIQKNGQMVWFMWIMGVQHAVTGRCMNEFMCRLLFVMQEEFDMPVFLASQGGRRPDCEGGVSA